MKKIRLFINDDDNQRTWLAGDPSKTQSAHSGVDAGMRNHQRSIQEIGGAGWTHSRYIDRDNERSDQSFATTRLFDSALECWQWMNSFSRETPAEWPHRLTGTLVERMDLGDGTWAEEILYGAVMQKPAMRFEGRTLTMNYSAKFRYSAFYRTGTTVYLTDENDNYLVDANGDYLIADLPD